MSEATYFLGRVTRCSTRGFVGAIRMPEPEAPTFGSFCQTEAQGGQSTVVGLIYDIGIQDDEFARQIATAESLTPEQLADNQANRQVPVEYSAIAIGYANSAGYQYRLPPQPPLTLAEIHAMADDDIRNFTTRFDFLPLVIAEQHIPVDELLVASLLRAANLRPEAERETFLLQAGRECARLLGGDLNRLENILNALNAASQTS